MPPIRATRFSLEITAKPLRLTSFLLLVVAVELLARVTSSTMFIHAMVCKADQVGVPALTFQEALQQVGLELQALETMVAMAHHWGQVEAVELGPLVQTRQPTTVVLVGLGQLAQLPEVLSLALVGEADGATHRQAPPDLGAEEPVGTLGETVQQTRVGAAAGRTPLLEELAVQAL